MAVLAQQCGIFCDSSAYDPGRTCFCGSAYQQTAGSKILQDHGILPYIINGVAISYAFSYFFSPINGAFNGILTAMHLESLIRNWLSDEKIVNFVLASVSVWRFSGYHVILFMAALQSIPTDILEAAKLTEQVPDRF